MNCREAGNRLFRMMDAELDGAEAELLRAHLSSCPLCTREYRMMTVPRRVARLLPVLEPTPFFYQKLRARLQLCDRSISFWQIVMGLSRQIVPALATVTLVLLGTFIYYQVAAPQADFHQVYDGIFVSPDQQEQYVLVDQGEITDDVVFGVPEGEESGIRPDSGNPSAQPK